MQVSRAHISLSYDQRMKTSLPRVPVPPENIHPTAQSHRSLSNRRRASPTGAHSTPLVQPTTREPNPPPSPTCTASSRLLVARKGGSSLGRFCALLYTHNAVWTVDARMHARDAGSRPLRSIHPPRALQPAACLVISGCPAGTPDTKGAEREHGQKAPDVYGTTTGQHMHATKLVMCVQDRGHGHLLHTGVRRKKKLYLGKRGPDS